MFYKRITFEINMKKFQLFFACYIDTHAYLYIFFVFSKIPQKPENKRACAWRICAACRIPRRKEESWNLAKIKILKASHILMLEVKSATRNKNFNIDNQFEF